MNNTQFITLTLLCLGFVIINAYLIIKGEYRISYDIVILILLNLLVINSGII